MFAVLTLTNRSISENTAKADSLEAQAQVATAKVGNLASYKQFNEVVKTRAAGVKTLAATRIDWADAFEQVSRVVPADVSLTQLVASTAPGQGGGTVSLRSALTNPALEIVGCAPSQSRVALLMARLRRLQGVQRVSVATSDKGDGTSSTASQADTGDSGSGGCQTTDQVPQFQMASSSARRSPRRPRPRRPASRAHPDPQRGHRRYDGDARPDEAGFLT